MDIDELYDVLNIDREEGIEYFENFADIVESREDIDTDALEDVLGKTDMDTLESILNEYFGQMEDDVPDDEEDLYTLVDNIGRSLAALADNVSGQEGSDRDEAVQELAGEVDKFREWYSIDENVLKTDDEGNETYVTMSEALFSLRGEKFGTDEAEYDFSGALEYDLDDYVLDISGSVDLSGSGSGDHYDDYDSEDN